MSLARAAAALCSDETLEDPHLPRQILEKGGARGIVPLLAVKTATFPVAQEFRTPYPFQLK